MKRELKFRAWDKKENELVTGDDGNGSKFEDMLGWFDVSEFPDRYEIMQYIGLKDKNGKEIYEGDIVKHYPNGKGIGKKTKAVVEYSERRACYMFKLNGLKVAIFNNMPTSMGISDPDTNLEVIGNIYENPELLRGNNGIKSTGV